MGMVKGEDSIKYAMRIGLGIVCIVLAATLAFACEESSQCLPSEEQAYVDDLMRLRDKIVALDQAQTDHVGMVTIGFVITQEWLDEGREFAEELRDTGGRLRDRADTPILSTRERQRFFDQARKLLTRAGDHIEHGMGEVARAHGMKADELEGVMSAGFDSYYEGLRLMRLQDDLWEVLLKDCN